MSNQQVDNTEARRQVVQGKLNRLHGVNADLKRQINYSEKLSFISSQTKILSEVEQSFLRLRERWFVYRDEIKNEIESAKQQLPNIYSQSEKLIRDNRDPLLKIIDEFHKNVMQVALKGGDLLEIEQPVQILEQELEKVRRSINSVGASLDGFVSKVAGNLSANRSLLNYLHWCIDQFIALKYEFEKGENIVAFKEAHYLASIDGKEKKIPGVLYVTDRRFVFERREKIVTKRKWGLFASETEDMVEVVLKEPISSIKAMINEVGGIVFKDFILTLQRQKEGAPLVFYVAAEDLPRWLYFQIDSLLKGSLNRVT